MAQAHVQLEEIAERGKTGSHGGDDRRDGLQAALPVAGNLLDRKVEVDAPNVPWVTDITYVWTSEGWLYLAAMLDLFPRRVVGFAMSERIDRQLALDALRAAVGRRPVCRPRASFRPPLAVRQPQLPRRGRRGRCRLRHEPQRQVLGQRRRGELLPHPRDRAGLSPSLRDQGGSTRGHLRAHRELLRPRLAGTDARRSLAATRSTYA